MDFLTEEEYDTTDDILQGPRIFEDEDERESYLAAESRKAVSNEYISTTMMQFFKGKRSKNGTLLTSDEVCTPENIDIVRELSVSDAIDILYSALQENGFTGTDFVFCMRLQNECSTAGVLKAYSGGIMVVYLKIVMGYDL